MLEFVISLMSEQFVRLIWKTMAKSSWIPGNFQEEFTIAWDLPSSEVSQSLGNSPFPTRTVHQRSVIQLYLASCHEKQGGIVL